MYMYIAKCVSVYGIYVTIKATSSLYLIFCFSGWPFLRKGSVGWLVNENKFN